jgi:hypothetical protein
MASEWNQKQGKIDNGGKHASKEESCQEKETLVSGEH